MTWAHFVPAYDQWLDNTYIKQWGEANDVEVKVDHINNALLYSTGASEVAAQSGHDLFWFISPPASFQKQALPVMRPRPGGDQEARADRRGLRARARTTRGRSSSTASRTDVRTRSGAVPEELLRADGRQPQHVGGRRKGAPKLKAIGHPVGLGMSNEIDSNMLLTSLLYCYGGFIQNEDEPDRHRTGGRTERAPSRRSQLMRTSTRTACPTRSSPGPPPRTTRPSSPAGSRWP